MHEVPTCGHYHELLSLLHHKLSHTMQQLFTHKVGAGRGVGRYTSSWAREAVLPDGLRGGQAAAG